MKFSPCRPGQCTEDGTHCNGCGRSHQEIADTKKLIGGIVSYAQQQDYDNFEEFVDFVSKKSLKKLNEA
mgnify:CR=1 FL=1